MLGVFGGGMSSNAGVGAGTYTGEMQDNSESRIIYAPVYHISGANEETVRKATIDDYQRFERFMQQYDRNNKRLKF